MSDTAVTQDLSHHESGKTECQKISALRKDISKLIAPWRKSREEPPFTTAEMVVMAIIASDKKFSSLEDLQTWILLTFRGYTYLAIQAYSSSRDDLRLHPGLDEAPVEEVLLDFPEALLDFDVPTMVEEAGNLAEMRFAMSADVARVYLREWLEPPREGSFPFLDLSAELRNKIYEMVLKYPEPGLFFCGISDQPRLSVMSRENEELLEDNSFPQTDSDTVISASAGENKLALLYTNKQVHQEAKSQFLAINTFHFHNLAATCQVLSRVKTDMKYMQSLHIDNGSADELAQLATLLSDLAPKKLRFTISREEFLQHVNSERRKIGKKRKVLEYKQVPELKEFAALAQRADEVAVHETDTHGGQFVSFIDFLFAKPKARSKKRT